MVGLGGDEAEAEARVQQHLVAEEEELKRRHARRKAHRGPRFMSRG